MNISDAYKLLELDQSSNPSKEDVQAAFRKMAKKHHPDKNKDDPNAENKFKEINSAYQLLTNPPKQQVNQQPDFQDMFSGFPFHSVNQQLRPVQLPTIILSVNLNFTESILGCTKDVVTDCHTHCSNCNGTGQFKLNDNCKHCNGQGMKQASFSRGNISFMQSCGNCNATGKQLKNCETCSSKGYTTKNGSVNLTIPGGVANGNVLRSHGTILQISVAPDPDMTLLDGNVVSDIELSLLEALKGTKRAVRTVKGEMSLKIPANVKNKDTMMVQGYGVPDVNGSHIFNIKVNYPENTDKLIDILEKM